MQQESSSGGVSSLLRQFESANDGRSRKAVLSSMLSFACASKGNAAAISENYGKFKQYLEDFWKKDSFTASVMLNIGAKTGSGEIAGHLGRLLSASGPAETQELANALFDCTKNNPEALGFIAKNYKHFRSFLVENAGKRWEAASVLMSVALHAGAGEIPKDVDKAILSNPQNVKNYCDVLVPHIAWSDSPLKAEWFLKIWDTYSSAIMPRPTFLQRLGLRLGEQDKAVLAIDAALSDPDLLRAALYSNRPELVWRAASSYMPLELSYNANLDADKFRKAALGRQKIMKELIDNAAAGDARSYEIASIVVLVAGSHETGSPEQRMKNLDKYLESSKGEKGWLFSLLGSQCFSPFDWDFYKLAFGKFNKMYESGTGLDELSRLIGVILAWPPAIGKQPGFFKQLEIAAYLLTSSGLTKKLFGSVGSIMDLAGGKAPVGRILDLAVSDDKARTFALMCLSNAVNCARNRAGEDEDSIGRFDEVLLQNLRELDSDDRNRLMNVLADKKLVDSTLTDQRTKEGAKYLLAKIREAYP